MSVIYTTQEIQPAKIITGEINPDKVINFKYQPYPTSSLGVIVVDENSNVSESRKFISLYALKSSWQKFQQVVDTTFSELEILGNPPLEFTLSLMDVQAQNLQVTAHKGAKISI